MIARLATALSGPPQALDRLAVGGRHVAAFHAVLILAVLGPIILAAYPPLVDYPNHLARIHILATLGDNPLLQERYLANWSLLPNLAMDALLVPLAKIVPIYTLGKLFVIATMLVFVGGVYALHKAIHGRVGLWPAVALIFVYNHVFAWGFLNYVFACGLYFFAFAGWIATRERWRWRLRLPVFAAVALALFFAHMFALGIYALSIAAYELARAWKHRDAGWGPQFRELVLAAAQFVPAVAVFFLTATSGGGAINAFGSALSKFVAITSATMFWKEPVGPALFLFFVLLLIGGMITRSIKLKPELKFPILVLTLAMVFMPAWLMSSWGADLRIPPVLGALVVAATSWQRRKKLFTDVMVMMGVMLLAMRVVSVAGIVKRNDAQVAELRAAVASSVPAGASLLPARNLPRDDENLRFVFWVIYHHFGAYAVIDKSVYLPTLFTDPEKQPILAHPRYKWMDTPYGHPIADHDLQRGARLDWSDRMFARRDPRGRKYHFAHWPSFYDYVLVFRLGNRGNPVPGSMSLVKSGSYFDIYKVRRK